MLLINECEVDLPMNEELCFGIKAEFPTISEMALNRRLPFCTYLCKLTFLALTKSALLH